MALVHGRFSGRSSPISHFYCSQVGLGLAYGEQYVACVSCNVVQLRHLDSVSMLAWPYPTPIRRAQMCNGPKGTDFCLSSNNAYNVD